MLKDYDNLLIGQYIKAIENPDSAGFKNGKWYKSTRKIYDSNSRGFGIDIKHNKDAAELTKNRDGQWLTEGEERELRNNYISYCESKLDEHLPNPNASEAKRAMAIGMIYRGDALSLYNNASLKELYYHGSDTDFSRAVDSFYNQQKTNHYQPERAKNSTKFMQSYQKCKTPATSIPLLHVEQPDATRVARPAVAYPLKRGDGGYLNAPKQWKDLSMSEKADVIGVGVKNGLRNLDDIRNRWNEFAEGGDSSYRGDIGSIGIIGSMGDSLGSLGSLGSMGDRGSNLGSMGIMGSMGDDYDNDYGSSYGGGGDLYRPSESIKSRIADWEGASMKTNRSFEAEAKDFNRVIPASLRRQLSQEQLDSLYSYGYNVGMGRLKERVLPTLTNYVNGTSGAKDVANSMWASKDAVLNGLKKRRAWERSNFINAAPAGRQGSVVDKVLTEDVGSYYNMPLMPTPQEMWPQAEYTEMVNDEVPVVSEPAVPETQQDDRFMGLIGLMGLMNGSYSAGDNPLGVIGMIGEMNGRNRFDDGGEMDDHVPNGRVNQDYKTANLKDLTERDGYLFDTNELGVADELRKYGYEQPVLRDYSLTLPNVDVVAKRPNHAENIDKVMLGTIGLEAIPFGVEAFPAVAGWANAASDAVMATRAGQAVNNGMQLASTAAASTPWWPYADNLMTSYFGADGINDVAHGNANIGTAFELTPLGQIARPIYSATKEYMGLEKMANDAERKLQHLSSLFNKGNKGTSSSLPVQNAAEQGRRSFLNYVQSPWYRERWLKQGYSEEDVDKILNSIYYKAEHTPFDFSKSVEELNAEGVTTANAPKEFTMTDMFGHPFSVFNGDTGMQGIEIGSNAINPRETAFHELLHYTTNNAKEIDYNSSFLVKPDNLFGNSFYNYHDIRDGSGGIVVPKGKIWQQTIMNQNDNLLPAKDPIYDLVWKDSDKAKSLLESQGYSSEKAENVIRKIKKESKYMWDIQEQRAHLQTWFNEKILPNIKNPNDANEIEHYFINNPDLLNDAPDRVRQVMKELRPGSLRDYAEYFARALSSLPIINAAIENGKDN